ncbi:UDP-2,3-diacylglucosamine diphosphatase [Rickettsiella endosymbiont of Dermanyssus gallinae]|uniref:UDP-2,3-diacylglucosamine diphosphatase n=1 Tax=Rickettsiella endosymbiont of Dermanyssus gallinae TaxID=2856608 RepID=UPI001C5282E1|nr:UDP-2,3-diacylglucosamine diphosphatase [Rickettsiella endosymbiont of Dermanyssus gallinae]
MLPSSSYLIDRKIRYYCPMSTLFISDLHLSANQPALTRLFLYFIQHQARKAEALYILGDLFESWIGDDDESPFNQQIAATLAELNARGVKTYFMPGNRDFLIGQRFIKKAGCQLLNDPTLITLYGIPTLLTHGDSLCTLDKNYMAFRHLARTRFLQSLFLGLPLFLRQEIARYLRGKEHTGMPSHDAKYDIVMDDLMKEVKESSAQWIIHGHTHQPCIQLFNQETQHTTAENSNAKRIKRFVLSDWSPSEGNALIVLPNRDSALVYFS